MVCQVSLRVGLGLGLGLGGFEPTLVELVFESASTAAFLIDHERIPAWDIVMETTSYDTIGNAYFARTSHTEVRGWVRKDTMFVDQLVETPKVVMHNQSVEISQNKLLIVTSASHMARTRGKKNIGTPLEMR